MKKPTEQWEERNRIVKLLREDWKPTCGYDSEEEKGFQKGIQAQINLLNTKLDGLEVENER